MDRRPELWYGMTLSLTLLLALWAGCTPPPPRDTRSAEVRTIKEGEVSWVRHWSTRDAERIVAHYAEDATMMAPNMDPAVGREAIREMVKELVRDGNFALSFEVARVELASSVDFGYVQGTYTQMVTDPLTKKPTTDRGTYLRVYRKQPDGAWNVLLDMRTSSLPALTPTAQ
jgi:uncharacterized protein (TIGR02246 family)